MSEPEILEGDLQSFGLPQVLKTLAVRKSTGILTVQGEGDIVAVSCLHGHIVTADSLNQAQEESLGELLVGQKLVTQRDFDAVVMEHQGSGGSLGELLESRGLVSREKLLESLRLQTLRLMLQILTWKSGEFKFYGGDEVSYEKGVTPISVEELLMRALADLGEASGIGGEVPRLDAIYRKVPPRGPIQVLGRDGAGEGGAGTWITEAQQTFLNRMNGKDSAFDIARSLGAGRFRTLFSLHQLIQNDLIELIELVQAAPVQGAATPTPLPAGTAPAGPRPSPFSGSFATPTPGAATATPAPGFMGSVKAAPAADRTRTAASGTGIRRPEVSLSVVDDDRTIATIPITPRPWIGAALAAVLALVMALALLGRPSTFLLPFPWQAEGRTALERQMRQTLSHKIDTAIDTYYLMDFQYPRTLDELVERGLLAPADLYDPARQTLRYTPQEEGYLIEVLDGDEVVESRTGSIQGDFSRDLEMFPAAIMKNPVVLLDPDP